ncbi:MAG TPA: rhodanese-like domain-containing protein [Acidimicrobiales bacterium]|nr:rhodanese-like domain-containing protein [Acidimicrobiales bacterium]
MGWLRHRVGGGAGVGPDEASALVRAGALLVDVREVDEWRAGHAPEARHLPLGDLGARLDSLPADRRLVVVCRSGSRSVRATAALVHAGYDAVNLDGGMRAWAAAGRPVQGAGGRPGVVA